MEKKLQLIRHLYGEADDHSALQPLLEDEEVKAEYQAMGEAKFILDHRQRERPDQQVLDQIFAVAAQDDIVSSPKGIRKDRGAMPRQRFRNRRWLGATSTVLALLVTVTIGYRWFAGPNATETLLQAPVADQAQMNESEEGFAESRFRADEKKEKAQLADMLDNAEPLQEAMAPAVAGLTAASLAKTDTTLPDWNDLDDIRRVERRIDELLDESDEFNWGQPAVPLEMLPASRGNGRLQQAGSRGNNQ